MGPLFGTRSCTHTHDHTHTPTLTTTIHGNRCLLLDNSSVALSQACCFSLYAASSPTYIKVSLVLTIKRLTKLGLTHFEWLHRSPYFLLQVSLSLSWIEAPLACSPTVSLHCMCRIRWGTQCTHTHTHTFTPMATHTHSYNHAWTYPYTVHIVVTCISCTPINVM